MPRFAFGLLLVAGAAHWCSQGVRVVKKPAEQDDDDDGAEVEALDRDLFVETDGLVSANASLIEDEATASRRRRRRRRWISQVDSNPDEMCGMKTMHRFHREIQEKCGCGDDQQTPEFQECMGNPCAAVCELIPEYQAKFRKMDCTTDFERRNILNILRMFNNLQASATCTDGGPPMVEGAASLATKGEDLQASTWFAEPVKAELTQASSKEISAASTLLGGQ